MSSSLAVILGSAHDRARLGEIELRPQRVVTYHGVVELHRFPRADGEAWVLFRHGLPHRYLPHQVPYRAHAAALKQLGVQALLVTSSVGLLDAALPLDAPLLVRDLLMLDNRLPDGSTCTMFPTPVPKQGHLVLEDGLFSSALTRQVAGLLGGLGWPDPPEVLFAYVCGPRTKTAAENALLARLGAQVNSMSLAPELVLANELEIPTAGLVVGHKRSEAAGTAALDAPAIGASLRSSRDVVERVAAAWLEQGQAVPWANRIYRYE